MDLADQASRQKKTCSAGVRCCDADWKSLEGFVMGLRTPPNVRLAVERGMERERAMVVFSYQPNPNTFD